VRPNEKLVKRSITIDPKLAEKIEDLRTKERPVPSFSTVLSRLAWKGLGKGKRKTRRKRVEKREENVQTQ